MGLKDYLKKKKEGFDEYKEKRAVQSAERAQTQALKQKLDRESLIEEGRQARQELKQHREAQRARRDVAALKEARREQKRSSGFLGKVSQGMEGMRSGIDSISNANESMFGKPSKKQFDLGGSGDLGFGGSRGKSRDPFDNMFGGAPQKRRKKKSKR